MIMRSNIRVPKIWDTRIYDLRMALLRFLVDAKINICVHTNYEFRGTKYSIRRLSPHDQQSPAMLTARALKARLVS